MSAALPLIRNPIFVGEHRRIVQKLLRLKQFAMPEAGFPSPLSALVACMDEIEGLLPELAEHFEHETRLLSQPESDTDSAEARHQAERLLGEHRPLLRELRALLESGRGLISELRSGRESEAAAEALRAYLDACVHDLLEHERVKGALLAEPATEEG